MPASIGRLWTNRTPARGVGARSVTTTYNLDVTVDLAPDGDEDGPVRCQDVLGCKTFPPQDTLSFAFLGRGRETRTPDLRIWNPLLYQLSHTPRVLVYLPSMMTGQVEVVVGSMFSGKTEELIRRVRRAVYAKQEVQAFKPMVDDRYDKKRIVSHGKVTIDALPISTSKELAHDVKANTQVVAIDEAQFFDEGIVETVELLANQGYRVIVAGLDQDFQGKPFGPMPQLMAIAEKVTKVRAVCVCCGAEASRTQRLCNDKAQVKVGGADAYEARCRACHEP